MTYIGVSCLCSLSLHVLDKKKTDDECEEHHHWGLPYMHCCEDIEDAFDGFE
jgi:hypothetical protein